MSQRKTRQTSEEVMAAREALERLPVGETYLPENVTPINPTSAAEEAEIAGRDAFKAMEAELDKAFGADELPDGEFYENNECAGVDVGVPGGELSVVTVQGL